MKLPCSVVRDLLPLYAEDLAGEESRTMVENHLEECAECRNVLEELKAPKALSVVPDTVPLLMMKQMLRRHTLFWCLLTGCLVTAIAFAIMGRMTAPELSPYIKGIFDIQKDADGYLAVTITGQASDGVDFFVEYFTNEFGKESMCITAYTSPWLRAANLNREGTVYTARSTDIRHIYYCDHSRGGKLTLLHGPVNLSNNPGGGILLLPRLTLNYYLFASAALTGLFGLLWGIFRKKAAGSVLLTVALGFACYVLGHLAVKGLSGVTYFLLQDLAFILLTAAALFGTCCAALRLHDLQK